MKKKFLQNLLKNDHGEDLRERIAEAIPATGAPGIDVARQVLVDAVEVSQNNQKRDPADLYFAVCSSTAAQLAAFLRNTKSAEISSHSLLSAQVLLKEVLTSKTGRKKTSDLSRQEQLAVAQSRHREKAKGNLKRIDVWLTHEAVSNLATIQRRHACRSQAEAIDLVLAAAVEGRILKPIENA